MADPGFAGRPGPRPGALRHRHRVREVVQRGRRHQRPQDRASTNATRRCSTSRPSMTESCAQRLHDSSAVAWSSTRTACRPASSCLHARHRRLRGQPPGARRRPADPAGAQLRPPPLPIGDYRYLGEKFPARHQGVRHPRPATSRPPRSSADRRTRRCRASAGRRSTTTSTPRPALPDWTPYAQKIKDNGVKGLIWTGEPENLGKLLVALNDIGYTLDFIRTDTNNYDQKLIDTGGSAVKNVYIRSAFDLFENAKDDNPTQQYLDAFKKYLPERQGQGEPRPAGVVGLAALRHRRERVRQRPHPQVRVRQRQEDQGVDRRWAPHARRISRPAIATNCFTEIVASPSGFKIASDLHPNRGCVPLREGQRVHAQG